MQIGNAVDTVMGSGRIGMDAEGAGTGFFAADGNVALAAADIDVAASFQAAFAALAVVLVLLFAGGFKAETGFNG